MPFDLWAQLWGDPTLMSLVVARMTPATLQQLRLALLPGNRSGDSSLEVLRVRGLRYHPTIPEGQLGRVVHLELHWAGGREDTADHKEAAEYAQNCAMEHAHHLTALHTAR
jgi:hypothetical protein